MHYIYRCVYSVQVNLKCPEPGTHTGLMDIVQAQVYMVFRTRYDECIYLKYRYIVQHTYRRPPHPQTDIRQPTCDVPPCCLPHTAV